MESFWGQNSFGFNSKTHNVPDETKCGANDKFKEVRTKDDDKYTFRTINYKLSTIINRWRHEPEGQLETYRRMHNILKVHAAISEEFSVTISSDTQGDEIELSKDIMLAIKKAYRIIYRKGYSLDDAIKRLHALNKDNNPALITFISSIERSERGLLR